MTSEERREHRYQRRKAERERRRQECLEEHGYFELAANRNALGQAANEAARGVRYKASVKRYMQRRLVNTAIACDKMEKGQDVRKGFVCFNVIERGKLRQIMSVHFSERVVQKSLNQNILLPVLSRSLIFDNGASRKGMGTSHALNRLTTHLTRYYKHHGNKGYVLQVDFKNYFGSISHEAVKSIVEQSFDDERVIKLAFDFIDSYDQGLGLGSETNQTFAVRLPSAIDHYIKEVLRIKAYARYNDDMYLIHEDKKYLECCLGKIIEKCGELGITVNMHKTHITKLEHGFTFLKTKFRLTETGKVLRMPCRASITRERRRLRKQKRLYDEGILPLDCIKQSLESWRGGMKHKNARRSVYNVKKLYDELYKVA